MKFLNTLIKMNLIDIDRLLNEVKPLFRIFNIPTIDEENILDNTAKIILRRQTISYAGARQTFKAAYIKYLKDKILDKTIDFEHMLNQYPTLNEDKEYEELIKFYNKNIKNYGNGQDVNLTFAKVSKKFVDADAITILKNCSEIQYQYVFSKLTENDIEILNKKYGEELNENNIVSLQENEFLNNNLLPRINNMINRFAGYYYFDQLAADRKIKHELKESFYNLENRYKRILIQCYGNQLDSPLPNDINESLEHKLKDIVIPKLRSYKSKIIDHRRIASFEKICSLCDEYSLSMLPQGYIDLINLAVNNNKKVFSSCSNSAETKELVRGIDALLEVMFSSEEISILISYLGLKGNKKLMGKEIAQKCNLSENKVRNIFAGCHEKLLLSPDLRRIFNRLNKVISVNLNDEVIKVKQSDNNLYTDFYGYFSKDEIKKLPNAMKCLSEKELSFINNLFCLGLSIEINLRNITIEEKNTLAQLVKKLKNNINTINNDIVIDNHKVYKICSRLYIEPIYNDICANLFVDEKEILNLCIRYEELGEGTISYISLLSNKSEIEVINSLKKLLNKIYKNLEEKSKSNVLIRQLMLK